MELFEIDSSPDAAVLRVLGEVDFGRSDAFRAAIERARTLCPERLVVALDDCTYFDCGAIGILVRLRREIGSRLKIVVPVRHVTYRVFQLLGLIEPLEIVPTIDEALRRPVVAP